MVIELELHGLVAKCVCAILRRFDNNAFQSRAVPSPESGTEGPVKNRAEDSPAVTPTTMRERCF